jgi:hypothetical protein
LEKKADGGAGMKSPFWFSSLLEFRLWYFPSSADSLIKDFLGLGDLEYWILNLHRDLSDCSVASESLGGLSAGMTATEAAAILDKEMTEMAKPYCIRREAGYYE